MPIFENTITGQRYELLEGTRLPAHFRRLDGESLRKTAETDPEAPRPLSIKVDDKTPDAQPVAVSKKKTSSKGKGAKKGAKNAKD